MTKTWCVTTESGARYLVDYDGNGGFGPVIVYDNGWLVRLRYRHTFGSLHDCPTCLDPSTANTYLPIVNWQTPDPTCTGTPGTGDPDRGEFAASFTGGPDYLTQPMLAQVSRKNWWHTWEHHSVLTLNPLGDWRTEFDAWRRTVTGYRPPRPASLPDDPPRFVRSPQFSNPSARKVCPS